MPPEVSARIEGKREIGPDDLVPEELLGWYERQLQESQALEDDVFWVAAPPGVVPWMEAILGCPLHYDAVSGSIWSEPASGSWPERPKYPTLDGNCWLDKLFEFTDALILASGGRFPVGVPLLRGPLDMLVALLGSERVCLDVHDAPGRVMEGLGVCTKVWIHVVEALLARIPMFHNGCVNRMRIWSPGEGVLFQEDMSILLSPEAYRRFVLPFDTRICERFRYAMIHLHSASLHTLEALLGVRSLAGVQVVMDEMGPPVQELLPYLLAVQSANKPLVVYQEFEPRSFAQLLSKLDHKGLCVTAHVGSLGEAEEALRLRAIAH
jgi:hypothetical protein